MEHVIKLELLSIAILAIIQLSLIPLKQQVAIQKWNALLQNVFHSRIYRLLYISCMIWMFVGLFIPFLNSPFFLMLWLPIIGITVLRWLLPSILSDVTEIKDL